jgi:alpha-D-xyloside xylohydrolase
VDDQPAYDYTEGVTLHAYQLADGERVSTTIPTTTGDAAATFETHRDGATIRVEVNRPPSHWRLLLVGIHTIGSVHGGTATRDERGTLIHATSGTLRIDLTE